MSKTTTKPENQSQAIKALLEEGMDKPKEIVSEIKKRWNMEVTAAAVSTVKSQAKGSSGKKVKKAKAGSDSLGPALAFVEAAGGLQKASAAMKGLTPALTLVEAVGGVEKAQEVLDRLVALHK